MKWLSWSWSFGRLRGVDFRFHFSILFSIPIAFYLFHPFNFREGTVAVLWLAGFVVCIFLHELGHAFAAQLVGVEVKSIVIWLLGGFTNLGRKAEKPSHNLVIFAAGPLVNMLLAFVFVLFFIVISYAVLPSVRAVEYFLWIQTFNNLSFSLAAVNVILIVFNLLPIYPLDGGNILHSAMELLFGRSNADLITFIVGVPILFCMIVFGVFARDYLLLFSCIFIALAMSTLNHSMLRRINMGLNYVIKRPGYYYMLGDFERAAQYYTLDIERDPQNPKHYVARAACLVNVLQKERAIADLERAIKIDPQNKFALELRGELYLLDKNYDAALEIFSEALKVNPNWAVPYFDRGSVFLEKKDFQTALNDFNKAISLSSPTWLLYLIRSIAHFRMGNFEAAHRDQDAALHISVEDSLVMTELNKFVYEDRLDWAEDYYGRFLSRNPSSGIAYHGRADACRVNAQHEQAIMDYTRAIELLPGRPGLYLGRGKSHQAIGKFDLAAKDYQHTLVTADIVHMRRQAQELVILMTEP